MLPVSVRAARQRFHAPHRLRSCPKPAFGCWCRGSSVVRHAVRRPPRLAAHGRASAFAGRRLPHRAGALLWRQPCSLPFGRVCATPSSPRGAPTPLAWLCGHGAGISTPQLAPPTLNPRPHPPSSSGSRHCNDHQHNKNTKQWLMQGRQPALLVSACRHGSRGLRPSRLGCSRHVGEPRFRRAAEARLACGTSVTEWTRVLRSAQADLRCCGTGGGVDSCAGPLLARGGCRCRSRPWMRDASGATGSAAR